MAFFLRQKHEAGTAIPLFRFGAPWNRELTRLKSRIIPLNLNNNRITEVIGRSHLVTCWTIILRLVGCRVQYLDHSLSSRNEPALPVQSWSTDDHCSKIDGLVLHSQEYKKTIVNTVLERQTAVSAYLKRSGYCLDISATRDPRRYIPSG